MTERDKMYPHVTGILGDEGENQGVLAVHAVLDPSPNFPDEARIIVGSPAKSEALPGYLPNLGGFAMGIAGAERLIATLQRAISDIRIATGTSKVGVWEYPPYLAGFHRIGRIDSAARRSLWLKEEPQAFELRAGCEGGDIHIRVTSQNPQFSELADTLGMARFAAEWENPRGNALVPMGIERHGHEDSSDTLTSQPDQETTVFRFRDAEHDLQLRVIVRHGRHFAVQVATRGADDVSDGGEPYWDAVTQVAIGVSPDEVMASLLAYLAQRGAKAYVLPLAPVTVGGVTTIDLGDLP